MPINDLSSLRRHLQWALELEHSTIPPYLTALYSLHEGSNPEARRVLLSVVIEEMLHMTLAANVLNALGGTPRLNHPSFMPNYPAFLPQSNRAFQVPLGKFSKETIEVFLKIEKPEEHGALPEDENYDTIGQFYEAIEEALERLTLLHGEHKIFVGDPTRQIGADAFHYDGAGQVIVVTDLATAKHALGEIVEQGEGMDHKSIWDGDKSMFQHHHNEVSHYFRLNELLVGRTYKHGDTPQSGPTGRENLVDWNAVYNIRANPKVADYPHDSPIRVKMIDFNRTYSDLLRRLHRAFNGEPTQMAEAVGEMYEIKIKAAELMRMPSGDGVTNVGLSYEFVHPVATTEWPAATAEPSIQVRPDGPYVVEGPIKLRRKKRLMSEATEALTWIKGETLRESGPYALCRCGRSDSKPFCDGSHARGIPFVGTETADTKTRAERAKAYPASKLVVHHDNTICATATFCENRITDVWTLSEKTDDTLVRAQVIAMVERCPSGALTYDLMPGAETIEPDLPREISVTENGPLWVSGGIPVERADGQPLETRNRMTLCRCGHSKNKPLCDGTHLKVDFKG